MCWKMLLSMNVVILDQQLSLFSAHFVYKMLKPRGRVKAQLMWGAASICHQEAEEGWFQCPKDQIERVRGTLYFTILPLSP